MPQIKPWAFISSVITITVLILGGISYYFVEAGNNKADHRGYDMAFTQNDKDHTDIKDQLIKVEAKLDKADKNQQVMVELLKQIKEDIKYNGNNK